MDDLLEIPEFLIRTAGDTKAPRAFSEEVVERRRTRTIVRHCAALLKKHLKRKARERRRRQTAKRS